jgi:tRNA G10  N-methylase Trm11
LERLTLPGELVVDPFCGSGTIGVALRSIGGRRYIGTDVDRQSVKAARARSRNGE